jgi:hypothetical protein
MATEETLFRWLLCGFESNSIALKPELKPTWVLDGSLAGNLWVG